MLYAGSVIAGRGNRAKLPALSESHLEVERFISLPQVFRIIWSMALRLPHAPPPYLWPTAANSCQT